MSSRSGRIARNRSKDKNDGKSSELSAKNRFKKISRLIVSISNLKSTSSRERLDHLDNREELLEALEAELMQPSPKNVIALSDSLLLEAKETRTSGTKLLYYALLLREWLYSFKPGTNLRRATMRTEDLLLLAREHFELWQRLGVFSEPYHLYRSRELFKDYLQSRPNHDDIDDLVTYCKVLQHLGENEEAAKVISLVVANSEGHPDYPNFLFFTGVIYKALGQYEKANSFFFEAQQVGPPKFFTKLEMMVIISRLIEEMQGEENADDDAYQMVHAHMILEGQIPEDTDYDDWISDSKTWLQLADKCAYHQMYSLATDFYGLGITRDPDAYKKPMLWYRFAKACKRCGRVSDAQLAIKQALTRSPYKRQLLEAQKFWSQNTNKFATTIQKDFVEIFQLIPRESRVAMRAFNKLQSFIRGNAIRKQVVRGIGTRKDIKRRMDAKTGVLFAEKHPILIHARADWMGQVSYITLFDVTSQVSKHLKLKIPFTPPSELGIPRKLRLHFAWQRVTANDMSLIQKSGKSRRSGVNEAEKADSVGEEVEEMMLTNRQVDDDDDFQDKIIFTMKFVDDLNKAYVQRKVLLILTENPSVKLLAANDALTTTSRPKTGDALRQLQMQLEQTMRTSSSNLMTEIKPLDSIDENDVDEPIPTGRKTDRSLRSAGGKSQGDEEEDTDPDGPATERIPEDNLQAINRTVLKDIYINNSFEKHVETNILAAEVTRFGLVWHRQPFLVRILNDRDVTQLTIFSVKNNVNLVFLMNRENITRSINLQRRVEKLLSFMSQHDRLQRYLPTEVLSKYLRDLEEAQLAPEDLQARERFNFFQGKNCFIKPLPEGHGVTIILADNNADPVIGDLYEQCVTIEGQQMAERDKFNRLAVSKSLFRDSFAYAFHGGRESGDGAMTESILGKMMDNDRIMQAIKEANETVSGKNWMQSYGKHRDEGVPISEIGNISPFSGIIRSEEEVPVKEAKLPLIQPEPEISFDAEENTETTASFKEIDNKDRDEPQEEVKPDLTPAEQMAAMIAEEKAEEGKVDTGKENMPEDKKEEADKSRPSTLASKPIKAKVPPDVLLQKARSVSPMKLKSGRSTPPTTPPADQTEDLRDRTSKSSSSSSILGEGMDGELRLQLHVINESEEGPSTHTPVIVPPLNLDSPAIQRKKTAVELRPDPVDVSSQQTENEAQEEKKTSPDKRRSTVKKEIKLRSPIKVISIDSSSKPELASFSASDLESHMPVIVDEVVVDQVMAEQLKEIVERSLTEIAAERLAEFEEELTQLAVDTTIADVFEEEVEDIVADEAQRKAIEEEKENLETTAMQLEDELTAVLEAIERQRSEEERLALMEQQRLAALEATERVAMEREEKMEKDRLFQLQQQRLDLEMDFRDLLFSIVENIQMKSQDFNINWIRRHFLEELRRQKAAEEEEERQRQEEEEQERLSREREAELERSVPLHKKDSKGKYFKIKSGQAASSFVPPSNTRVFQRSSLTPMLNHPVKRQPLSSSIATVTAADLQSPLSIEDINHHPIKTSFAFDSADELKNVLENLDAHSLGSATQSIQHYMTNLHKQPSWINEHKGPKKAKKIQYSSTFNALYNDEENSSLASVAKSLSSTSWSNGKFSIEKSVVEATNIGVNHSDNSPDGKNGSTTARSASSKLDLVEAFTAGGKRKKKRGSSPGEADKAEDGLYIQSVKQVQRLGYVPTMDQTGKATSSKRPWAYAAHWQRLLSDFLAAHAVGSIKRSHNPNVGFSLPTNDINLSDGEGSLASSIRTAKHVQRPPFWELKKKIKALEKAISSNSTVFATKNAPIGANPRLKAGMLSVEEIICALAETRGSVGEVITRLSDHNLEFISEIQLVCSALNVKSMVCALPGGADLFNIELETVARQQASPLKSLSPSKTAAMKRVMSDHRIASIIKREKAQTSANATVAMSDDVSVLSDDNRSAGSLNSSSQFMRSGATGNIASSATSAMLPSSGTSVKSQLSSSQPLPTPVLLTRPQSLPSLRDQPGEHSHLVYPHLQISQNSLTVKRRSSIVTFKPTVIHPIPSASSFDSAGGGPSIKSSFIQIQPDHLSSGANSPSPSFLGRDSSSPDPSQPPPMERISSTQSNESWSKEMIARIANETEQLLNLSPLKDPALTVSFVSPKIDASNSRSNDGLMTPTSFTSMAGSHHSLATKALKKSFRVQQNLVDELYDEHQMTSPTLAVMTRRDAILAKQEETLLKSDKVYIREVVEKKHRVRKSAP